MNTSYIFAMKIKEEAFVSLMKDYATYLYMKGTTDKTALKNSIGGIASAALERGEISVQCVDRLMKSIDNTNTDNKTAVVAERKNRFVNNMLACVGTTPATEGFNAEEHDLLDRIAKKEKALAKLKNEYIEKYRTPYIESAKHFLDTYTKLFDQAYTDTVKNVLDLK